MSMAVKIIYGTAWGRRPTGSRKERLLWSLVQYFKDLGPLTQSSACQPKHYREDLVGEALQLLNDKHGIKREDLFLQTKYTSINGQDLEKPLPYNPNDPIRKQIESSFQTSLTNLRTTYIDSYVLHSPLKTIEHTLDAWRALMALQDAGKVHMIGVSNTYDIRILHALNQERKVQVVQNRWYEGNAWDKSILNYCKEHDIQYQSFWTLSGSPSLLSHPSLMRVAKESHCTPAQAVFKLAQLEGVVPLSGTKNEAHMRDDLAVEEITIPRGSQDDLNAIRETVRG